MDRSTVDSMGYSATLSSPSSGSCWLEAMDTRRKNASVVLKPHALTSRRPLQPPSNLTSCKRSRILLNTTFSAAV